mmetsp:Transcript_22310/g.67062  ORF Transcript_22310/g.67062 Transcript_22310/m.67062 type:complete len:2536 (-) Transcript_22310:70-7677(-)|eukprot:CAMPEP_0206302002 /NCGR_PEP_ID=MMETSP0106_2-20121207/8500_1 /ASSEMBLY_ACC=CAM_ASM_000206 /TAXON_ID=81532 /ORGANISM="Acanthoeca-like sp., Strain 10tr" /LENGTH=2535 /DNA_ID=CAMNT_0053732759 /DNA_START=170 /DNA_END=7777 /DNA_ORIENTATION=-
MAARRTSVLHRKNEAQLAKTVSSSSLTARPHAIRKLPNPGNDIELDFVVGEGAYGKVYRGTLRDSDEAVAVKVVNLDENGSEDFEIALEVDVLRKYSKNINVARFFGAYCDETDEMRDGNPQLHLWLVMEYCAYGSASRLVQNVRRPKPNPDDPSLSRPGFLPESTIAYVLHETLSGLEYLHSNKVVHRDVKGQNILFNREGRVKLVDFGVSAKLSEHMGRRKTVIGTPYWMAPEVILCETDAVDAYDARCDVWSLGIVGIELAEGAPPLVGTPPLKALLMIPKSKPPTLNPKIAKWSQQFQAFLTHCLVKEAADRPRCMAALQHNFMTSLNRREARDELLNRLKSYVGKDTLGSGGDWKAPDVRQESVKVNDSAVRTMVLQRGRGNVPVAKEVEYGRTVRVSDNLAQLGELDEAAIVYHLNARYSENVIYTLVGEILLACNPFKPLPVYTSQFQELYLPDSPNVGSGPHIYQVAQRAFKALRHTEYNQVCVISGESGAGKTETAKSFIAQILTAANSQGGEYRGNTTLDNDILATQPLLEAVGNAQTVMNKNSSRFGKFLELKFDSGLHIRGAQVSDYLLEKSRVVQQAERERNFHVFYQFLGARGGGDTRLQGLPSMSPHSYRYLCSGIDLPPATSEDVEAYTEYTDDDPEVTCAPAGTKCEPRLARPVFHDQSEKIDKARYDELLHCMSVLRITPPEVAAFEAVLATILLIGNIDFVTSTDDADRIQVRSVRPLMDAAVLVGASTRALAQVLLTSVQVTRGEEIVKRRTMLQADDARDAAAKALYGGLFRWLVSKINAFLIPAEEVGDSIEIGVLDIFGFENFEVNSFEQLCINVANEQLQYYFNQQIFSWELEDMVSEGLDPAKITFVDNKPLLDMFLLRPAGLFAVLDEESFFPKATDLTFTEKLGKAFKKNKGTFIPAKQSRHPTFSIKHFAGTVEYDATGFLEKNRDSLAPEMRSLFEQSANPLVKMLFDGSAINPIQQFVNPATEILGQGITKAEFGKHNHRIDMGQISEDPLQEANIMMKSSKRGLSMRKSRKSRRVGRAPTRKGVKGAQGKVSKKSPTVGKHFKTSLADLMQRIMSATPHFVRCIKPNAEQLPDKFEKDMVETQLRYTGVCETIRIRRDGFPVRLEFAEFLTRYQIIAFPATREIPPIDYSPACVKILSMAPSRGARGKYWELGKTKIFMKYFVSDDLANQMDRYHRFATTCQRYARGWLAKRVIARLRREAEDRARREAEERVKRERQEREQKEREAAEQSARVERERRDKAEEKRRNKEVKEGTSMAQGLDLDNLTIEPWNPRGYDNLDQNLVGPDRIPRGVERLNRYINILPNPRTRVRLEQLEGNPQTTYINANHVSGHDGKCREYIATQGPTKETAPSFWRMIWEYDCRAIVMVTGIVERGIDKCFRYWPSVLYNKEDQVGESVFGDITVKVTAGYRKDGYITSKLKVSRGDEDREIWHFWFDAWPDHGVPRRTDHVVKMLQSVRAWSNHPQRPWVVHCSAGIGRTGTFIAIDHGLKLLRERGRCDVLDIVRGLRKDRGGMVQHAEQGEFVHRTLTAFIKEATTAAVIEDCDNDVLRTAVQKAFDVVPASFTVHPSQVEGDEGAEAAIPAYRQEQLLMREHLGTDNDDNNPKEGTITNAAKRKLKRREQKLAAHEERRKAIAQRMSVGDLPDVAPPPVEEEIGEARRDMMSPVDYEEKARKSSIRVKSKKENVGALPGQVMEAAKQQKGFKMLLPIGEHTHTIDVNQGDVLTVLKCLTEDWYLVKTPSGQEGLYPATALIYPGDDASKQQRNGRRLGADVPVEEDATAVISGVNYRALAAYTARSPREISFAAGDTLRLLEQLSDDWLQVQNSIGATGIAPANHLERVYKYQFFKAVAAFDGPGIRVSLESGEVIRCISRLGPDWLEVEKLGGVMGLAPCNHLEELVASDEYTLRVARLPSAADLVAARGMLGANQIAVGDEVVVLAGDDTFAAIYTPGGRFGCMPTECLEPVLLEATQDYSGTRPGHIDVSRGDCQIELLRRFRESGVVKVRSNGDVGLIPATSVQNVEAAVLVIPGNGDHPAAAAAPASALLDEHASAAAASPMDDRPADNGRVRAASMQFQNLAVAQQSSGAELKQDEPNKGAELRLKNKVRAASTKFQTPTPKDTPLSQWDDSQVLAWLMDEGEATQTHYDTIKRAKWRGADLARANMSRLCTIGINDIEAQRELLRKIQRLKRAEAPPVSGGIGRLNAGAVSQIQASMKMAAPGSSIKPPTVGLRKATEAEAIAERRDENRKSTPGTAMSFDEIRQLMRNNAAAAEDPGGEADYDVHTLLDDQDSEAPYMANVELHEGVERTAENGAQDQLAAAAPARPTVVVNDSDESGVDIVAVPAHVVANTKMMLATKAEAEDNHHGFDSETLKGVQRNKEEWRQMKVSMKQSAVAGVRAAAQRAQKGTDGYVAAALSTPLETPSDADTRVPSEPAAARDASRNAKGSPLPGLTAKEEAKLRKRMEKAEKKAMKAEQKEEKRRLKLQKKNKGPPPDPDDEGC